jgi:hypothetical protein
LADAVRDSAAARVGLSRGVCLARKAGVAFDRLERSAAGAGFLTRVQAHFGSRMDGFLALPSVFWFGISDRELVVLAWIGAALSFVVMLGYANALLLRCCGCSTRRS